MHLPEAKLIFYKEIHFEDTGLKEFSVMKFQGTWAYQAPWAETINYRSTKNTNIKIRYKYKELGLLCLNNIRDQSMTKKKKDYQNWLANLKKKQVIKLQEKKKVKSETH